MEQGRKYGAAESLPSFAKGGARKGPLSASPSPGPSAPAAAPRGAAAAALASLVASAPAAPPVLASPLFDLADFKGDFSFDTFFNTLAGDLIPPLPDASALLSSASTGLGPPPLDASAALPAGASHPTNGGPSLAPAHAAGTGAGTGTGGGTGPSGVSAVGFPEAEAMLPRFKDARSQLLELSRRVDERLERLRKDVAAQDSEHKETLAKLEMGVEGLFDSFGRLDARISGVGQTAARIGDHLQSADAQREAATQIIELIKHLMDFNRSTEDFTPSAALFSDDKRMGEAASIAQKLRALAEEDEDARDVVVPGEGRRGGLAASPGLEAAVHNLEEFCNDLENKLLQKFDAAADRKDLKAMAECAKTLEQFQRGTRAMHRYVATRPMFLDVKAMEADIRIATGEGGLSIASAALNPMRGLTNLYKQIIETLKEESVVVSAVFSSPKSVMAILVQRVLLQRVHNVLEHMLKDPDALLNNPPPLDPARGGGGLLPYLRTLASAYEKTVELGKQLQDVGCGDLDVEGAVEGLFSVHKDVYSEVENASLMQLFQHKYAGELSPEGAPTAGSGASQGGTGSGAGDGGLVTDCVRWNEEALARCKILITKPEALVETVLLIFNVLLGQVITYTLAVLQRASNALAEAATLRDKFSIGTAVSRRVAQAAANAAENAAAAGEQGIRTFLMATKKVSANAAFVHQHFVTSVAPVLALVDESHKRALAEMGAKMGEAEAVVLRGLQSCIEAILGEVERVLQAEQKASEFRPSEDGIFPDNRPTVACIKVKAYLERTADSVVSSLDGPNCSAFLEEVGSCLHKALLTHIQKFTFNTGGGLRLKRDVSEYTDFVRCFKAPAVDEKFESLSALVNLFIVPPDSLRKLVDSLNLNHKDALIYIQLREDFRSARIASQFSR